MVTNADTDFQARVDALRGHIDDLAQRVRSFQRQADDLTSYALRIRDNDVPCGLERRNGAPALRQGADGRLGGAGQSLRIQVVDQKMQTEATPVTVSGGTVRLSGSNVVLRGKPIELSASPVSIHAARVTIAGTVRCDTLRANSFVAKVYKTSAGNVW